MYDLSIYYYLKQYLKVIYLTGSKDETFVRCPICGDSMRDSTKARFYIHNNPPFKWYCFNCDSYGIINEKILDLLTYGDVDIEFLNDIRIKQRSYNSNKNKILKKVYNNKYFKRKVNYKCHKSYLDKLGYLEERLGVILDYSDIPKFKIIPSIIDFFDNNGLDIDKRCKNDKEAYIINELDDHYIGFLSSDKNVIIFRNLYKKEEKYRFNNFKIFNDPELDKKKIYNISNNVSLMKNSCYTVHMAEGPIDIMSVYLNIIKDKESLDRDIFMGNGGKGYVASSEYLTSLSLINNDYNIYSDEDVSVKFYKNIKKYSPEFKNSRLNVYYNNANKDFGVSKDLIDISKPIRI